jgi:hypothetical protein
MADKLISWFYYKISYNLKSRFLISSNFSLEYYGISKLKVNNVIYENNFQLKNIYILLLKN